MKNSMILLVDDDPFVRRGVGRDLEDEGYRVTTADSGERAIELLATTPFDLVLTDLVMGEVDGIKVLKKAKEVDPEIITIILTGYGNFTSAVDALRLNADDYLLKPCCSEELLFRLSRCFDKQELQRRIKIYEDLLPICCVCKKIRDDAGREPGTGKWIEIEQYLHRKVRVTTSHGYCDDCYETIMKEMD